MEYVLVLTCAVLAIFIANTKWMKEFQFRYAIVIFAIGFPLFLYFVIIRDFSFFKLGLFLIMLGSTIYTYTRRKSQLPHSS